MILFANRFYFIFSCFSIAGAKYLGVPEDVLITTEAAFLKVQKSLEDNIIEIAKHCGKKSVVICDRGCMDIKAYLPDNIWKHVLEENDGVSQVFLRDNRYDAVVHMVTAAIGAEKFYTTANNAVRTETVEQAAQLDQMVMDAWMGHKNHFIIDNASGQSFDDKISRVLSCISVVIGLKEVHQEKLQYFSISKFDHKDLGGVEFVVDTTILDQDSCLIKRTQEGASSYFRKSKLSNRIINGREYAASLTKAGGDKLSKGSKSVRVFRQKDHILTLETFQQPEELKGQTLLQVTSSNGGYQLPAYLEGKELSAEEAGKYLKF